MTEHPPTPDTPPPPAPQADPVAPPPPPPVEHRRLFQAALALVLAALAFGAWGLWLTVAAPRAAGGGDGAGAIEALRQEVATLRRSDQISRDANRDLQGTLAERDEEIAGLRADVAFYERFVGATGQRRGLSVHDLQLRPQGDDAWHFVATLTQNINRGAVSSGRLTLAVEGTGADGLERLAWTDLRQQANAPATDYSFKYFQQVEGDIVLPPGFRPLRVHVRLEPAGGSAVEQSFPWVDTAAPATPGA